MQILFVCQANMCRSALAEAFGKKLAAERELPEPVSFRSAGLMTADGYSALPEAVEAARRYGVELEVHETTPFMLSVADGADYIVAMTRAQKQEIIRRLPVLRLRTFTLAEFVKEFTGRRPSFRDVEDPVGGPPAHFERCARQIHTALSAALDAMAGMEPRRRTLLDRLLGR